MKAVKKNSFKAWMLASRPKTLAGAATPVIIGSSLAAMDKQFQWMPALLCLCFAFLMQIAANFINDLFDFLQGTDRKDRLGPQRACAQGWISAKAMKKGVFVVILIACLTGSSLIFYGGWKLIGIGIMCILFAFFYTTGPYPLSYHGWGDVLVLLFFGFIPVGCTYYVQAHAWTGDVTIASLVCGLTIDTLLVVNNYRDRETDKKSGKFTIVVRFGETFGQYLYLTLGVVAALLCLSYLRATYLWAAFLPQIYLIFHFITWRKMVKIYSGRGLNAILGETSRNILLMGILLSAGFLLS